MAALLRFPLEISGPMTDNSWHYDGPAGMHRSVT